MIHKLWQQTPCVKGAGREAACISARRSARQISNILHPTSYILHPTSYILLPLGGQIRRTVKRGL